MFLFLLLNIGSLDAIVLLQEMNIPSDLDYIISLQQTCHEFLITAMNFIMHCKDVRHYQ